MNNQITKKIVATFTSVATVAMMTAGAFMPMAAGAQASGLATGLLSCWNMDEASNPRVDSVGGYNLTGTNGFAAGILNNAALFASAYPYESTRLMGGYNNTLSDFAISFWANANTTQRFSRGYMFYLGDTAGSPYSQVTAGLEYDQTSGSVRLVRSNSVSGYTSFAPSVWHHVIITYDSTAKTLQLHVDGVLAQSVTYTTIAKPTSVIVYGGAHATGYGWDGMIDEASAWSRVLTGAEISHLYNNGTGAFCGNGFVTATPTPPPVTICIAKPGKVCICHYTGEGTNVIEVSSNAVKAHLKHGDDTFGELTQTCDVSLQVVDSGTSAGSLLALAAAALAAGLGIGIYLKRKK